MRRRAARALFALLALLPAAAAAQQLTLDAAQRQAMAIELYEAGRSAPALSSPLVATAVLDDRHQRVLTLPVSGTVEQLGALPGARVAAGDVLGQFHSGEALTLQRAYLGAVDRLERSAASWRRDDALYRGGAIARKRWQQTRAQWRQDDAEAGELASQLGAVGLGEADLKALRDTRELRALLPLRAPIGGVVINRDLAPGQAFGAGQELFHLGDPARLWLAISVPPALAPSISPGDAVYRDGAAVGRVLQLGVAVDPGSRSVPLIAELGDAPAALLPGQAVLVQLTLQASAGLWLPRDSVVTLRGQAAVFVASGDGFAVRPVQVAPALDGWTALGGLSAGERVAAAGSAALKGMAMGLGEAAGDAQ